MENNKINSGHYLELMDRLHILASTLNDHCLEHPLTECDEEIRKAIEIATELTYEAYQVVGHKSYEYDETNNPHIGHS
jgi:hypothetical protein